MTKEALNEKRDELASQHTSEIWSTPTETRPQIRAKVENDYKAGFAACAELMQEEIERHKNELRKAVNRCADLNAAGKALVEALKLIEPEQNTTTAKLLRFIARGALLTHGKVFEGDK